MNGELRDCGYTPREAGFLELAGLQSGYFLRRHFNTYIERECGALGQRLIERALRLGHVAALPGFGAQQIFHVCGRPAFRHMGEPQNRNRRRHASDTIRHRLMMLDLALGRREDQWLLTVDARREAMRHLAEGTAVADVGRILADRQPASRDAAGCLRFFFVDEGLRSFSKWERFLKDRCFLLRASRAVVVTYASCNPSRFPAAERVFRRMVGEDAGAGGVDRERLGGYFASRRLFEERRFENFDKLRLDRLRDDQRAYAGEVFDDLYRRWRQEGDAALAACHAETARFETQPLAFAYSWLSPVRFQERRVPYGPDTGTNQEGARSSHREARQERC